MLAVLPCPCLQGTVCRSWHTDTDTHVVITPPGGTAAQLHSTATWEILTVSGRHSGCRSWPTWWLPQRPPCRGWQGQTAWWRAWPRTSRSAPRPRPPQPPPRGGAELLREAVHSALLLHHWHLLRLLPHSPLLLWTGTWSLSPPVAGWWVQGLHLSLVGPDEKKKI